MLGVINFLSKGEIVAWTDYFVNNIIGAKVVSSKDGQPFVSYRVAPRDYVEIHLTTDENKLPFEIKFVSFDSVGEIAEERVYGGIGTKDMARKFAIDLADLRLNSREFVLDGE